MNKKLLVFICFLLCTVLAYSQERVNKPIPIISAQPKGVLIKSTGWLLNPEGQWISRANRIPAYIDNEFKLLIDYEYDGLGIDNFISYQLREIKMNDSVFTILIKKYKDGYYKYSSIKEGWTNYNSVTYYVFDNKELSKLKNINYDSVNVVELDIRYTNNITWINNETYISDIQKDIVKQISDKDSEDKSKLILQIAPYKTKKIVQFQIYSTYSKYNIITGIVNEHKVKDEKSESSLDEKQIYLTKDLFKYCYYEVDLLTFNNFLKISN